MSPCTCAGIFAQEYGSSYEDGWFDNYQTVQDVSWRAHVDRMLALAGSQLLVLGCWLLWAVGCATSPPVTPSVAEPYLDGTDIENRALAPNPKTEPLPPEFVGQEEWVTPCFEQAVDSFPVCSKGGILMSEAKAARVELYRLRYEELLKMYVADRSVWRAHRQLYEKQLQLDEQRLRELTPPPPTWWDQHGTSVVIGTSATVGLIAGAALTVGVGYALYGTQVQP